MSSPDAMPLQDNMYITLSVVDRSHVPILAVAPGSVVKEVVKAQRLGN
jgi:hypothetical protein